MSATSFSPSSAAGHSYHLLSNLPTEEMLEDAIRFCLYDQLRSIPNKDLLKDLISKHQTQLCDPKSIINDDQFKSVELLSSILCYAIIYKEREIVDLLMPMDHMLSHFFAFLPKISADQRNDTLMSAIELGHQKILDGLINPPKNISDMTLEEISDVLVLAIRRKDLVTLKGIFLLLDINKLSRIVVHTINNNNSVTINELFTVLNEDKLSNVVVRVLSLTIDMGMASHVITFINNETDYISRVLAHAIKVEEMGAVKAIVKRFNGINDTILSNVLVKLCLEKDLDTARKLINTLFYIPQGISGLLHRALFYMINDKHKEEAKQLTSVINFRKLYTVLKQACGECTIDYQRQLINLSDAEKLYKVLELARQQDPDFASRLVSEMDTETLNKVSEHATSDNNEEMLRLFPSNL